MIKVLFFGPVADRVKMRETQVEFSPGMTLHDVLAHLGMQHPGAFALRDNDEIALMAKFSGG